MSASTQHTATRTLALAALGVVYGDIGISPLYAFREAFSGAHAIALNTQNLFAVLSMMFWAVTLIVSAKYVLIMLRFDNRGEGGVLALLSWAAATLGRRRRQRVWLVVVLGAFSVSLFYGDAVITPAISVLSAVEGIAVVQPTLAHIATPIALVILVALFSVQRKGTAAVGALFGPIMLLWFGTLAAVGAFSIVKTPEVIAALDPRYALDFIIRFPATAMLAASAVFLCVTGAEALYADMGHFGPRPVRQAWFTIVFPALMVNYFGQGALLLRQPEAARNPFYLLMPESLVVPMILLATAATVIASQAVISGAFSATQQASRLNFLPRLRVVHTSDAAQGQVYIPLVNWLLLVLVIFVVLEFRSSDRLAAAYGIAVAGDLFLSSVIVLIALPFAANARLRWLIPLFVVFLLVECAFLVANSAKILHGGWFPLALATIVFTVLTSWRRGIDVMRAKKDAQERGVGDGLQLDLGDAPRVEGAAVFFSSSRGGCPGAFLHNLKHNRVVHETTVFLTVVFDDVPFIQEDERVELQRGANGLMRLTAHFGYREEPDIRKILALAARKGLELDVETTSFFTSKPTVVSISPRGLLGWRRSVFGWMLANSVSVARYFNLPANRVIELGTRVGI